MDIDLSLPYSTDDLAGTGGRLREAHDHFLVEELPLYNPEGKGQHLYINLTKEGLTTIEVQHKLAALFGLEVTDIGFAGLKDKHARTTQTFSVNVGKVDDDSVDEAVRRIADSLPVTVNWAKLHRNKLRLGHLLGNRFTVTITRLKLPPDEALMRARAVAARLRERGEPNFFGPQRFGFDANNIRWGLEIIQGRYSSSDRWLRRFLISSYQSYLCNRYLSRRLELGAFDYLLEGDIAKKYSTGGLFQVDDWEKEQARYQSHEISFTAPIYGSKMWTAQGPSGELEAKILSEAEVSLEQFDAANVIGTRRLGRLLPSDLDVSLRSHDLVVNFSLPKGAFATTILREIMKVDIEDSRDSVNSVTMN